MRRAGRWRGAAPLLPLDWPRPPTGRRGSRETRKSGAGGARQIDPVRAGDRLMRASAEWLSGLLDRCYGKALVLYPAEFRGGVRPGNDAVLPRGLPANRAPSGQRGTASAKPSRAVRPRVFHSRSSHGNPTAGPSFAWRMLRSARGGSLSPPSRHWRSGLAPTAQSSPWCTESCCARFPSPEPERLVMIWDRNPKGIRAE